MAMRVFRSGRLSVATIAVLALSLPTLAAERSASVPDFSGQWGRDMTFFEPPESGPGPVVSTDRKPDGTANVFGAWAGDHAYPILKPEAADAVRKRAELARSGTVAPDMHNSCQAEPPPYVMSLPFGVQIVQRRDEIVFIYLINNALRPCAPERAPSGETRTEPAGSLGRPVRGRHARHRNERD